MEKKISYFTEETMKHLILKYATRDRWLFRSLKAMIACKLTLVYGPYHMMSDLQSLAASGYQETYEHAEFMASFLSLLVPSHPTTPSELMETIDDYSNEAIENMVVDDLKLKKHPCFLRRASYGFYSTGALYTFEDISHPVAKEELSDETRQYIEKYGLPVQVESYSLAELEAYADKCREQVFSHLSESFYDRNMQMIMKMLTAAINKEKKEDKTEEYQHPKSTFNEYLEEYLSVLG